MKATLNRVSSVLCMVLLCTSGKAEELAAKKPSLLDATVVIRDKSEITEGCYKGQHFERGMLVNCSMITENRVWLTGPVSGWVRTDSVLRLEEAEKIWSDLASASTNDAEILSMR